MPLRTPVPLFAVLDCLIGCSRWCLQGTNNGLIVIDKNLRKVHFKVWERELVVDRGAPALCVYTLGVPNYSKGRLVAQRA